MKQTTTIDSSVQSCLHGGVKESLSKKSSNENRKSGFFPLKAILSNHNRLVFVLIFFFFSDENKGTSNQMKLIEKHQTLAQTTETMETTDEQKKALRLIRSVCSDGFSQQQQQEQQEHSQPQPQSQEQQDHEQQQPDPITPFQSLSAHPDLTITEVLQRFDCSGTMTQTPGMNLFFMFVNKYLKR